MTLWSRLFRTAGDDRDLPALGAQDLAPPTPGSPTRVTVIPGKLAVSFHALAALEGREGQFLSAVSEGLGKHRQRELVLSLECGVGPERVAIMRQIGLFFRTVHAWAKQNQRVDAGSLTQFGEQGLFGRAHSGVAYAEARATAGLDLPAGALSAVLLDAEEVRCARAFGSYRVLTRLGQHYRHFPYPSWSELARPSMASVRDQESLLARLPTLRAPGVSFVVADRCLSISLSSATRALLARGGSAVSSSTPFALLTTPAASANAVLVWHPGQTEPTAISPDGSSGSRVSGSCLLVQPGDGDDQTRLIEDGYSLLFSARSWSLVSAALLEERPLSLPMADNTRLELTWLEA